LKEEPPKVRYNVVYEPLKAMHAKVQLRVLLESGGRWVFEVDLVANEGKKLQPLPFLNPFEVM